MNIQDRIKIVELENAISSRNEQINELNTLLSEYETKYHILSKGKTVERKPTLKEMFLERIANSQSFNSFCDKLIYASDVDDVVCRYSFSRKSKYREKWYTDDYGKKRLYRTPHPEDRDFKTVSEVKVEERKHGEYVEGKEPNGTRYFTYKES